MTSPAPLSACCKAEYIIATKPHLMSNSEPYPMCTTCGLPCDLQPPAESEYDGISDLLEHMNDGDRRTVLEYIRSLESKLRLALDGLEKISKSTEWHRTIGKEVRTEDSHTAEKTLAQIQLLTPKA